MADDHAVRQPSSAETRLVVTRADGTRHDLGVVSAYYRNPLRRAWWLLIRKPAAERRIRRANRSANQGS